MAEEGGEHTSLRQHIPNINGEKWQFKVEMHRNVTKPPQHLASKERVTLSESAQAQKCRASRSIRRSRPTYVSVCARVQVCVAAGRVGQAKQAHLERNPLHTLEFQRGVAIHR